MTNSDNIRLVAVRDNWLVIDVPDNPLIRLDAKLLDRALAFDAELALTVGDLTSVLEVPEGVVAAAEIAAALAKFTRLAQITSWDMYKDAKRRLELAGRGRADNGALSLYFGDRDIFVSGKDVSIGRFKMAVSDVMSTANAGANLDLPDGSLPASLVMLVVAATKRREDVGLLSQRIAEFEQRIQVKEEE